MSTLKGVGGGNAAGSVGDFGRGGAATCGGTSSAGLAGSGGSGSNTTYSAPSVRRDVNEMLGNGIRKTFSADKKMAQLTMYIGYDDIGWVEYNRDQLSRLIEELQTTRDKLS